MSQSRRERGIFRMTLEHKKRVFDILDKRVIVERST